MQLTPKTVYKSRKCCIPHLTTQTQSVLKLSKRSLFSCTHFIKLEVMSHPIYLHT